MNESNKLSKQDRDLIIAESVQGMTPDEPPHASIEKQLREWLPQLTKLRAEGFTPEQLVTVLAKPRIGIKASARSIRKVLSRAKRPGPKPAPKGASTKTAPATPAGPKA